MGDTTMAEDERSVDAVEGKHPREGKSPIHRGMARWRTPQHGSPLYRVRHQQEDWKAAFWVSTTAAGASNGIRTRHLRRLSTSSLERGSCIQPGVRRIFTRGSRGEESTCPRSRGHGREAATQTQARRILERFVGSGGKADLSSGMEGACARRSSLGRHGGCDVPLARLSHSKQKQEVDECECNTVQFAAKVSAREGAE